MVATDPYRLCPCGSGKKIKWCCGKILPEIERILTLIQNKQGELALKSLEKLAGQDVNAAFVKALAAQAVAVLGDVDEGFRKIEKVIEEHPDSAVAREIRGDMLFEQQDVAEALDAFMDALAHFPPSAIDQLAECLVKVGHCHMGQGRPLAAWAAWQRALKLAPDCQPAIELIDEYIRQNEALPNAARQGLRLKPPDELAVFNEERQEKWDEALSRGVEHVDDLLMAFEYLANDDPHDAAAWYNLALAAAWSGDNAKALEALDHYVKVEEDFDAAADAWDLAEVLRDGVGAEEYSDNIRHIAVYETTDLEQLVERLQTLRNVAVLRRPDERITLHWMSGDIRDDAGEGVILGGPPRHLAQMAVMPNMLEIAATSAENLAEVKRQLESACDGVVTPIGEYQFPGGIRMLDSDPLVACVLRSGMKGVEPTAEEMAESLVRYFEQEWIHKPLKSLGGLTPLDASASDAMKPKLEGTIRFRERRLRGKEGPLYNYDRLRSKLGLIPQSAEAPAETSVEAITAYSPAQLAGLDPASLADDQLLAAYRSACGLAVPATAAKLGQEVVDRESLCERIDVPAVYRRLVTEALDVGKHDRAAEIVHRGLEADERRTGGKDRASFERLLAHVHLARGEPDEACALYRRLIDEDAEDLELLAQATERLLSAACYPQALEFAELGLRRAEELRVADYQGQFREYIEAAGARV